MKYAWLLLVVGLLGGWHWWQTERPVARPPGVVAAAPPVQRNLDPPPAFEARGHTLTGRARYDLTARVLRRENYRVDGGATLAPVDLGVGWGPMSDTAVIDQLEFSQMGRFLYWRPKDGRAPPVPPATLVENAAQMHLIPASDDLEARLKRLRPGQVVTIGGYLVDVRGPGGFTWNTSLTRTDTGNGACEIVWVESLAVD
jgi:hypothetical protein